MTKTVSFKIKFCNYSQSQESREQSALSPWCAGDAGGGPKGFPQEAKELGHLRIGAPDPTILTSFVILNVSLKFFERQFLCKGYVSHLP